MIAPRVAMIQDAARLHYAIPLAMQRAGILERMFTDFYVKPGSSLDLAGRMVARIRPRLGRAMRGRRCDELDARRIVHNPLLAARMYRLRPTGQATAGYAIDTSRMFGDWVRRHGLGECNAIFGFIRDFDPGLFQECHDRGLATVGDQMLAPLAVEIAEAVKQAERFPGWEPAWSLEEMKRFEPFQNASWSTLKHFTCASNYVRDGLISQGIQRARISVMPYPIDVADLPLMDRQGRTGPVTVGLVGAVTLRKGAPYVMDVARRFDPTKVRFVMVGKVGIDPAVAEKHKGAVELAGAIPRAGVARALGQFDVFLFPSTCEGCAGSVIEAMASGLPVVASPNSGTFARDGIEGFIRAYDDIDGMAEAISRLVDDRDLRLRMGAAARQRVCSFDIDHYAGEVGSLFRRLLNPA